jgi:hypothetical protein
MIEIYFAQLEKNFQDFPSITYYHWANDETVRKNSFTPEPIDL